MRVGLLADIHYKPAVHEAIIDALVGIRERFEDRDVDRAVVLGDVVHPEADGPGVRELAKPVADALSAFPCPVRVVPGNHDAAIPPADYWESTYGTTPWAVDAERSLVYLDSSAPRLGDGRGELGDTQLESLDGSLADLEDALVFVHHPVHHRDVSGTRWFATSPERAFCGDKDAFDRRVDRHGTVAATFNGHLHDPSHTVWAGVEHFTVDSFTKELDPAGSFGAHAVVERDDSLVVELVDGDGWQVTYERPL